MTSNNIQKPSKKRPSVVIPDLDDSEPSEGIFSPEEKEDRSRNLTKLVSMNTDEAKEELQKSARGERKDEPNAELLNYIKRE